MDVIYNKTVVYYILKVQIINFNCNLHKTLIIYIYCTIKIPYKTLSNQCILALTV